MVLLNSRDRPENVWLPKIMHLHKQHYNNQNAKNLPKRYYYSSNNAISSFKQAKCYNIHLLENFKKNYNKIRVSSDSLSTGTDLEPIPLCM